MAITTQKVLAYSNISTDFTLDVLAKKIRINIDGTSLIRNSSGQLAADLAPYVLSSTIGATNGIAPIDATGHVPNAYINFSGATFKGTWDASSNTPTVVDGLGTNGDFYLVSNAGTQDLGSGSLTFSNGDILIYNSSIGEWQRSGASMAVTTVNGLTGTVTLTTSGIAEGTNPYFTAARAQAAISVTGNYLTYSGGVVTSSIPLLATVASTGSYTDLLDKPTIPLPPALVSTGTSGTITPTSTFYTLVSTAAGVTQTLPSASSYAGHVVNAKNGSAGDITVTGSIDGLSQSLTVPAKSSVQLQSDGAGTWWIL